MAHSPARALDVGSVIAGTYTIEGLLGKGGMGAVFVASHARLPGKKVAVKVLHPDVADGDSLARFKREAEIASRLGHANIVEVHDWNELPDGTPYIVYELLQGESLYDRLKRGPMTLDEVMAVVRQVGSALAAAHREHIVHRDLKPQNIFLVQADDGVSVKAKVLDFGISKIRGSTTVKTQDTAMLGTPQYMAPEQAMGQQDLVDQRTDVFAFGAVVYEMLAGAPAFQGATIPEVVFKVVYEETPDLAARAPAAPPHVVAAVHKALAKKGPDRWQDVSTFVEALTGSPLASGRRHVLPAVSGGPGAATGAAPATPARSVGQEAFAATMGSGDHASAMASSVRASMAAAQTVAGAPQSGNAPGVVVVGPESLDQPGARAGGKKSKTTVMVVMMVVVVAAAAVVIAVVAGGGGGGGAGDGKVAEGGGIAAGSLESGGTGTGTGMSTGSGTGTGTSTGTGTGTGTEAVAADAGVVVDAAVVVNAARPVDAGVRKPKIDAGAVITPPDPPDPSSGGGGDDDDDEKDPELKEMLEAARAALKSGDDDEALRLAKRLTTKFPKAQAGWAIRAQANCRLDDQEAARADFRRVRRPGFTRAVRKTCRDAGIDL